MGAERRDRHLVLRWHRAAPSYDLYMARSLFRFPVRRRWSTRRKQAYSCYNRMALYIAVILVVKHPPSKRRRHCSMLSPGAPQFGIRAVSVGDLYSIWPSFVLVSDISLRYVTKLDQSPRRQRSTSAGLRQACAREKKFSPDARWRCSKNGGQQYANGFSLPRPIPPL